MGNKDSFGKGFILALLLGFISIVFHITSDDEDFKNGLNFGMFCNALIYFIGFIIIWKMIGFI